MGVLETIGFAATVYLILGLIFSIFVTIKDRSEHKQKWGYWPYSLLSDVMVAFVLAVVWPWAAIIRYMNTRGE